MQSNESNKRMYREVGPTVKYMHIVASSVELNLKNARSGIIKLNSGVKILSPLFPYYYGTVMPLHITWFREHSAMHVH